MSADWQVVKYNLNALIYFAFSGLIFAALFELTDETGNLV